ncbi:DUF4249 family protein [Aquimarina longa]|uniref:DUF4249 family protein n=1 Tax=Aquimarina longa TaxID=1080221 RepID=UPI000AD1AB05|nr:DUF4249 family protein [Aquimarina longa]
MKYIYKYIVFVSLSALTTSCFDEITPDFEFKEQVFISGLLTSDKGAVSVQIQKTVAITDTTFSAVNDAQVSLFTRDTSNTISLISDSFTINNGKYTTSDNITPIIGNTYWIEVKLKDQTVLRSEEEILNPPIPIVDMVKKGNTIRITFIDPIEEENFYFIRVDIFRDEVLISKNLNLFDDRLTNQNSEKLLIIDDVNEGDRVRTTIYNLNFNTFQFYNNIYTNPNDPILSVIVLPTNSLGNVTNIATDELVLGNFGIAGFSTMTMDF